MDMTALLRGIIRQLLEDGVITADQYGKMLCRLEEKGTGESG